MIKKFLLILIVMLSSSFLEASNTATKKIIKYKKTTSFDLTGTTINSKAKTPDIFYVFRRKRTTGGKLNKNPDNFNYQHNEVIEKTKSILKR